MIKFILFAAIITFAVSKQVDCSTQVSTVLSVDDYASLLDLDVLEEETLNIKKDCLKKMVCVSQCPCGKSVYFEFLPSDPKVEIYKQKCQQKKETEISNIIDKELKRTMQPWMDRLGAVTIGRGRGGDETFNNAKNNWDRSMSDITKLVTSIKKLCSKEET